MNALRSLLTFTLVTAALVAFVAACAAGGAAASATPPPEADVTVTARNNAFEPAEVTVAAGEAVPLFFRNLDGQPHNVAIYRDASLSETIFSGEIVTNAAVLYEIPALQPGDYFFRCDVHPDMTGSVVVEG